MSRDTFQINIPISKIDEEQRIVTGIATTESVDSQGDIVDYEASKKAFKEWTGNIREMHNPVAIGKSIDVQFDDANKQVILSSYISKSPDGENAWQKVKEGILTGYSIGGKIYEIAKDKAVEGANRIIDYALSETSLVDNPANPDAKLVMVKSFDGKLQRVEAEENVSQPHSETWWINKFMKGADMKKSVYDAGEAISIASQLTWLIMQESREGEPEQVADLVSAFNALRDFAAKEVAEGDDFDWTKEYNEVIELAQKAINLRKGTKMSDKKVEKSTAVVGGEERNEVADVVTTAEENGRPINDTEERAKEAEVEVAGKVVGEDEDGKEVVQEPIKASDVAVEDEKKSADDDKKTEKDEEAKAEAPEVTEDGGKKKADEPSDLMKSMETLLTKLNSGNGAEIKKVADLVSDLSAKVEKMDSLEERVAKLEKTPLPTKTKASYAVVEKGESEVADDTKELLKRQEELIANPESAKPGEMYELAAALRKANVGQRIDIK